MCCAEFIRRQTEAQLEAHLPREFIVHCVLV
jgi:hypothetical protein